MQCGRREANSDQKHEVFRPEAINVSRNQVFYFAFHDDVAGPSKHDGVARPLVSHLDAEKNRVTIFSILSEVQTFAFCYWTLSVKDG